MAPYTFARPRPGVGFPWCRPRATPRLQRTVVHPTLSRRGYRMLGTVTGRTEIDCERRFLESWLPQQPAIAPSGGANSPGTLAAAADNLMPRSPAPSGGTRRRWFGLLRRK